MMINSSMFSFAYVKTCLGNKSEEKKKQQKNPSYGLTEKEKLTHYKKGDGGGAGLK